MTHYDLLVIGTGSGNSIVDEHFDSQKVAIAEAHLFGGTCLNVGCIPTKMFVKTADLARTASAAHTARFGLTTSFSAADWPAIRDRVFGRIDPIEAGGRDYRTNRLPNVTVYPEHVRFTGPRTVVTDSGAEITADRIVIAAGSHAHVPELPGLDAARVDSPGYPVATSNSIMRIDSLPRSLTIIGGGFIAAEFAHVFSSLGVDVTVLVRGDHFLSHADSTVSERFTSAFAAAHHVRTGTSVTALEVTGAGVHVTTRTSDRGTGSLTSDMVLLATGRVPSLEGLGVDRAGFDTTEGRLAVDDRQRVLAGGTPVPGVFALGDISSPYLLKHVANHEARVVRANLLADIAAGAPGAAEAADLTVVNHRAVPSAVFSDPQVATVGLTEEQAAAAGVDYTVKVQEYADVAYGWALEDRIGFVKLLADRRTRRLLGAHIVGDDASMLLQPLVQAMSFDLPADRMAKEQYWIHPALPEVVENALLGLEFD
ncbi:mycothione reductase [Brevibacterium samyangense]|uniref:Mycothione reductase n=1 Tax=Brevibacterium samyangense TaxID=366888 RepID=A0ABP5EY33_9MICO